MSAESTSSRKLLWVRRARAEVESVRHSLTRPSPDLWKDCMPQLESAIRCLESVEHELRSEPAPFGPARRELVSELGELRRGLCVVSRLIENAAHFYRGWAELLAAAAGGYTRSGRAADLPAPVQFLIRG